MQSDGNSFCGDVVLDSLNMVYSEEEKYEKKIFGGSLLWRLFISRVIEEYAYLKNNST